MPRSFALVAVMALACTAISAPVEAVTFTFAKIADTDTPMPGSFGNFAFFNEPALDGGTVAFFAGGMLFFQQGIYASAGGSLQLIVDNNTAIPGGTGNFTYLASPAVAGGTIAFRGDGASLQGIYTSSGGTVAKIVDTNTPIPGGIGNFIGLGAPLTVDGGNVVFAGAGSSSQRGLYSSFGGALSRIVDTSTPLPGGGGNFGAFFSPSLDAGSLVFGGFDSSFNEGVYLLSGGSLTTIANTSTAVPGGSGTFAFFGNPSFSESDIAFLGYGGPFFDAGIYVYTGSTLNVTADVRTPVPGGAGTFTFFGDPSMNKGTLALVGADASFETSLYLTVAGVLTRIIGAGDVLDGKPIAGVSISRDGLSGNAIAFRAIFVDGSEAIFIATAELTVPVTIDIKPGEVPNSINLGSGGTVPVAIMSTATFDATAVDPSSISLAGATVALRGRGTTMASFQDIDGDGRLDLVVHVVTDALELSESDTEAVLTGQTYSGQQIRGTDSVRIVP